MPDSLLVLPVPSFDRNMHIRKIHLRVSGDRHRLPALQPKQKDSGGLEVRTLYMQMASDFQDYFCRTAVWVVVVFVALSFSAVELRQA